MRYFIYIAILLPLFLSACGGPGGDAVPVTPAQVAEKIDARFKAADSSLTQLKTALDKGLVRNALMLKEYTKILKSQKPELGPLLTNLEKDAGSEGSMYQNLANRLSQAKNNPDFFESPVARYQEVNAVIAATKPDNYNLALTDVVNVVADMSTGLLPRVEAPAKSESLAANKAQDLGAGSQLIGNPAYGQWSNQGGTSVWEWYGMYAMFRDLTGGRSYSYGHWDRNRDWSYYSDIGRNRHGSHKKGKSYAPSTKKYSSSRDYGVSRKSYGSNSADRRASTYSKKAGSSTMNKKSSSMPGSFRNKSTYSRSRFGGK